MIEPISGDTVTVPLRRGRIETDIEPRREPVTIITNNLDNWPCELGSLTPNEKAMIGRKADEQIAQLFADMFQDMSDLFDDKFPPELPPHPHGWIVIDGA